MAHHPRRAVSDLVHLGLAGRRCAHGDAAFAGRAVEGDLALHRLAEALLGDHHNERRQPEEQADDAADERRIQQARIVGGGLNGRA